MFLDMQWFLIIIFVIPDISMLSRKLGCIINGYQFDRYDHKFKMKVT